jgi:hypothetical protein
MQRLSHRSFSGWTERANVLFVDSPVGSGFSFARNEAALPKTDEQIVDDLVQLLIGVFEDSEASYILGNAYDMDEKESNLRVFVYGESYAARYATLLGERLASIGSLPPIQFGGGQASVIFCIGCCYDQFSFTESVGWCFSLLLNLHEIVSPFSGPSAV